MILAQAQFLLPLNMLRPLLLLLPLLLFYSGYSQTKKYHLEVTFLEIIFNGDSAEYGKGNTLIFDTDAETDLRVIDTIGGRVLGIKLTISKENGIVLLAFELYRQIDGKWSAFTQFAPTEPGTLKPYSAYVPNKPSIKNQDIIEIPDPPFSARMATAIYVR